MLRLLRARQPALGKRPERSQSSIEQAILIVAVATALGIFFTFVRGSVSSRIKLGADGLGHGLLYGGTLVTPPVCDQGANCIFPAGACVLCRGGVNACNATGCITAVAGTACCCGGSHEDTYYSSATGQCYYESICGAGPAMCQDPTGTCC